jgi:o-succinylbenzoate---CoA ligase
VSAGPLLPLDLRRHAAARPRALAIRDGEGDHDYASLDRAADLAASGLQASGIAPGDRVALLVAPSAGAVALLVGVARAGAVAVPLGTRLTRREVGIALGETTPALVVHDDAFAAAAAGHGVPSLVPADLAARAARRARQGVDLDPAAPVVAVLTSGTTGRPKAALLSHAALAASAAAWSAALPPATGWLLCLGLAHVAGLGVAWRALGAGVPLHVASGFEAPAVLAALRAPDAPSHVSLVPVQLARLLDAADAAGAAGVADAADAAGVAGASPSAAEPGPAPPPGLRAVLLGGAPIPPALVRRAVSAGWPVIPTYGLTEAGSGVTALPADEASEHPGSAGRPLPGVAVRVAEPGPDGVGEIQVATPAAFAGYLGRDGVTAAAFTADRWLRTADLGRLDATGRLFVVDRRDDLLISGGENVSPAEVEAVLEDHPAVAQAGVAGRADATWGAVPVAGIVLGAGADDPGDEALRAWCRGRLAPSKVPAAFTRLDALPRTGSGKLRRQELSDLLTPLVVVLHATLSTGRQLTPLVRALAAPGDLRVIAPDRLGSGERRLDPPREVDVAEHLADLERLLDGEGVGRAVLVGHSFGGIVALEAAARLPDRVAAVVAYEPPYGPLAEARVRRAFALVARATCEAAAAGGRPAAARAFMRGVAGRRAWDALPERTRTFLEAEGGGAVADAAMRGLEPDSLDRIACPVAIFTGSASEPFYAPIADALAARIPGARRVDLPGLRHTAPISDPGPVAAAVRAALAESGIAPPPVETSA